MWQVQYPNWIFLQLFLCATQDTYIRQKILIFCFFLSEVCEKWSSLQKKRELIDYVCLCAKLRNQIKFVEVLCL